MKLSNLLIAATFVASSTAFAGAKPLRSNAVCKAKAEALVKAAFAVDFPEDVATTTVSADDGVRKSGRFDDGTWTFVVEAQTEGGKFPLNYNVKVDESGPNACYLNSLAPIQN